MGQRVIITTDTGYKIKLELGHTREEWEERYGVHNELWDFLFEELIDGSVEPDEYMWYWLIDGRCCETYSES